MSKKRRPFPHTYVIVFLILVFCAVLTWIVPGGHYARESVEVNGTARSVVVPDSYTPVESQPQSWEIFTAIFQGLERAADIIFYILIIGGAFWMINDSHALDVAITSFLEWVKRLERLKLLRFVGVDNLLVACVMLLFSFFGAVTGMSEETIAFVAVFVPLSMRMGYDSIVGISMCFLAAGLGWAGSLLNPFTIGIAQGLAGIPLFSGLGYRLIVWAILSSVGIAYVLLYMRRLRHRPTISPVYETDAHWRSRLEEEKGIASEPAGVRAWVVYGMVAAALLIASLSHPITTIIAGESSVMIPIIPILSGLFIVGTIFCIRHSVQLFIFTLLLLTIFLLVVGVMGYSWYIREIAALFLVLGLLASIAYGRHANEVAKLFIQGASDILSAALVVGLASAIIVILTDGNIIDSILHAATEAMRGVGPVSALTIMYVFYMVLNVIIASGSAKAALTIPLMSQFSDLLGISRQMTVLAYQLGSGTTHLGSPTSAVMIGVLSVAHIPYVKWIRWFAPLLLILVVVSFLLLLPPLFFHFSGF